MGIKIWCLFYGNKLALHIGHLSLCFISSPRQEKWNICSHSNLLITSPLLNSDWQITHSLWLSDISEIFSKTLLVFNNLSINPFIILNCLFCSSYNPSINNGIISRYIERGRRANTLFIITKFWGSNKSIRSVRTSVEFSELWESWSTPLILVLMGSLFSLTSSLTSCLGGLFLLWCPVRLQIS